MIEIGNIRDFSLYSMSWNWPIRIKLTSLFVSNQEKALNFYTEKLGFVKKTDFTVGDDRWLIVNWPESSKDMELLLEPNNNPEANVYQEGIFNQGIPAASFESINMEKEYSELVSKGITFRQAPIEFNGVKMAIFEDTCGNLIQLHQNWIETFGYF